MEIELQPAGVAHSPGQKTLIAPAVVYNYGFANDWELVLESQLETPLSPPGRSVLTESGIFLKHVLRPGTLQEKTGPSVATEFGVLLPDTFGPTGTGVSAALLVSQRWDWGTVHFNAEALWTRDQQAGGFTGIILEGPATWTVRPVAELSHVGLLARLVSRDRRAAAFIKLSSLIRRGHTSQRNIRCPRLS